MSSVLTINLLQQVFLILVGLGAQQLIAWRYRLSVWESLPYAWVIGVVFIYLSGFVPVRFELATTGWAWYCLGLGTLMILFAAYRYQQAEVQQDIVSWELKWYDYLLLLLIMLKLLLLIYINLVGPVVDSDATNHYRHVGLAKYIVLAYPLSETMAYKSSQGTMLSPSILHAWFNIFQDRWHDSIATFHYVFIWLSLIAISFVTVFKIVNKVTPALVLAYLTSTVPMFSMHVARPGFADMLIAVFFAMIISGFTISFITKLERRHIFMAAIALIGGMLTKMEGTAWLMVIAFFMAGLWFRDFKQIPLLKIVIIQLLIIIVGYLLYVISADWIVENIRLDKRLGFLFQKDYDGRSIETFFAFFFTWGASGLWWFLLAALSVYLTLQGNLLDRIAVFYTVVLLFILFYFANFTGNVEATLSGVNVGRFIIQLAPILWLVYTLSAKKLVTELPHSRE